MGIFPLSTLISNNVSDSLTLSLQTKSSHIPRPNLKNKAYISIRHSFFESRLSRGNNLLSYKGLSCAKNSDSGGGDKRALETVLKLYDAIRERNTSELSNIIGEECSCVCNFITAFQPCYGKKQVISFFTILMMYLGSKIQFVVEPTSHDGMNVGISWKLEWSKHGVPLGKGFSFYTCHVYQGKVMIRNVEMFMEPLFHFEPLTLKMIGFVMNVMDTIGSHAAYGTRLKKAVYLLISLMVMITLLCFIRVSS